VSTTALNRRLKKLERQRQSAAKRVRLAWWEPGEPEPKAEPGERLIVLSWDDHPEPLATAPSR
jgi:hypothetical protein